jgi:hypothetical protein
MKENQSISFKLSTSRKIKSNRGYRGGPSKKLSNMEKHGMEWAWILNTKYKNNQQVRHLLLAFGSISSPSCRRARGSWINTRRQRPARQQQGRVVGGAMEASGGGEVVFSTQGSKRLLSTGPGCHHEEIDLKHWFANKTGSKKWSINHDLQNGLEHNPKFPITFQTINTLSRIPKSSKLDRASKDHKKIKNQRGEYHPLWRGSE